MLTITRIHLTEMLAFVVYNLLTLYYYVYTVLLHFFFLKIVKPLLNYSKTITYLTGEKSGKIQMVALMNEGVLRSPKLLFTFSVPPPLFWFGDIL